MGTISHKFLLEILGTTIQPDLPNQQLLELPTHREVFKQPSAAEKGDARYPDLPFSLSIASCYHWPIDIHSDIWTRIPVNTDLSGGHSTQSAHTSTDQFE